MPYRKLFTVNKTFLQEVAWSCTRLEENLLITCCVFGNWSSWGPSSWNGPHFKQKVPSFPVPHISGHKIVRMRTISAAGSPWGLGPNEDQSSIETFLQALLISFVLRGISKACCLTYLLFLYASNTSSSNSSFWFWTNLNSEMSAGVCVASSKSPNSAENDLFTYFWDLLHFHSYQFHQLRFQSNISFQVLYVSSHF